MRRWHPDILDGYQATELELPGAERAAGEPADVELIATLVRKVPAAERPSRAVLYVHGWNDYFFQTHLADLWTDLGYAFYAVDLRRYGRSLRPGHLRGFILDLDDYALELDTAAAIIAEEHEHLVVMGHSTGGLIASLWADRHPAALTGLVLNSPWLDLQGSAIVRALGTTVVRSLGTRTPTSAFRLPDLGYHARTLHASLGGEWDYDLELKSTPSPPVRVGWLRAILQGHQRVAAGLSIDVPVLVLASTLTDFSRRWHDGLKSADIVLDVEQIAARAVRIGRHVTVVRIEGGMHDVILSAAPVRQRALDEIARFAAAYLGGTTNLPGGVSPMTQALVE